MESAGGSDLFLLQASGYSGGVMRIRSIGGPGSEQAGELAIGSDGTLHVSAQHSGEATMDDFQIDNQGKPGSFLFVVGGPNGLPATTIPSQLSIVPGESFAIDLNASMPDGPKAVLLHSERARLAVHPGQRRWHRHSLRLDSAFQCPRRSHRNHSRERPRGGNGRKSNHARDRRPLHSYRIGERRTRRGREHRRKGNLRARCSQITLVATPIEGYRLSLWSGNDVTSPESGTQTVTVNDDVTLTATFEIDPNFGTLAYAFQAEDLGNFWHRSPWFGYFHQTTENWIYHLDFGWIYSIPYGSDSLDRRRRTANTNDNGGVWFWQGGAGLGMDHRRHSSLTSTKKTPMVGCSTTRVPPTPPYFMIS